MEYIGDEKRAAPRLVNADLTPEQWTRCASKLTEYISTMLSLDIVHGDLSAYNILYFEDGRVIINVPQAMEMNIAPNAFPMMARDLNNLGKLFRKKGGDVSLTDLPY